MEAAAKTNNKSILQLFVDRAYDDSRVLIALIKKILPDKTHIEGEISAKVVMMPAVEIDGEKQVSTVGD